MTLGATVAIIISKTRERDFYFLPLRRRSDKDDWLGKGVFQYDRVQRAFKITDSDSGFIFSKALTWSDYKLDFDFKILSASIGVIIRATNLSNLVMLQIFDDRVKAHIRINGFWFWWEATDTKLTFQERLNLDNWHRCELNCDKDSIQIRIYQLTNLVMDRQWRIPEGPVKFGSVIKGNQTAVETPFAVNLEFGTIGFRNNGAECGVVRNLLIERL